MNPGTRGGQPELERSERRFMTSSVRVANRRMRVEILPQLQGVTNPNLARSWNPLVAANNPTGFAMKLRMPDKLVTQILQSEDLMTQVAQIVEESLVEGMFINTGIEHTPFIAALIRDLFSENPRYDTTASDN